jgi:cellulose synthase/poly-beta-1,6-N-acetylglucosamine synthase-like glycosyltransferase
MIEWFFIPLWAIWMVEALTAVAIAVRHPSRARQQRDSWRAGLEPARQQRAVLIVAIKGFDPDNTPRFFQSLRTQHYREYRLILTMESESDPVAPWLRAELDLAPGTYRWTPKADSPATGLREIELVFAGHTRERGQKVHNQIAAFAHLVPEDAIVAFADADIHSGPEWLSELLAPINAGTHPVSTTYRYLIPRRPTLANLFATVINGSVATLGGPERWSSLWGGSMAIARADFDDLNVPALFAGSLNDDLRLGRAARRSGRRVGFVRKILMPSPVDFTWATFFEFGRRQYYQVRHFAPIYYRVSHFLTWTYVLGFLSAWSLALATSSALAWGVIVFVFLCDQLRALGRWRALGILFDAETLARLRPTRWIEHLLTPVWMAMHAGLTTSALFTDRIRWAGIDYRVKAEDRTEVIGRDE